MSKQKYIRINMANSWARTLLNQPGVEYAVKNKTNEVLKNAKELAKAEAYDTGKYHDSFHTDYVRSRNDDRIVGRVVTDDPKWVYLEYGTRKMQGKHILLRAVQKSDLGDGRFGGPKT